MEDSIHHHNYGGPPQEGLDPKLRSLSDLAPATSTVATTTTTTATAVDNDDIISTNDSSATTALVSAAAASISVAPTHDTTTNNDDTIIAQPPPREHPPQFGQDPKLLACVSDGERILHHEAVATGATAPSTAVKNILINRGVRGGAGGAPPPYEAMPDPSDDTENNAIADPSPTIAVAAAMLSIHQNNSSPPPPPTPTILPRHDAKVKSNQDRDSGSQQQQRQQQPEPLAVPIPKVPSPPKTKNVKTSNSAPPPPQQQQQQQQQATNSNPNLTSSESLAEWNRIHANTGPNYNFFKKSQHLHPHQGNKKIAWMSNGSSYAARNGKGSVKKEAAMAGTSAKMDGVRGNGTSPPNDVQTNSSKARVVPPASRVAADSTVMKPLFTLNFQGDVSALANVIHAPKQIDDKGKPPEPENKSQINPPSTSTTNISSIDPSSSIPHVLLPPKAAATAAAATTASNTNTNFWLQEEEERFLLGLRLYGWGQWKRIQTIVQTRTNKQIKSHAQKREKVNPQIKLKYGKGKSRRGRISSKVLADDAKAMALAGGSVGEVAHAILSNDVTIPSLDQAWKDVYGTNNGDGPNSRHRRYRQQGVGGVGGVGVPPLSAQLLVEGEEKKQWQAQQLAMLGKQPAEDQPPHHPQQKQSDHQKSASIPPLEQPIGSTVDQYQQHMGPSRFASAGVPPAQPLDSHAVPMEPGPPPPNMAPPLPAVPQHLPVSRYSSTAVPVPATALTPLPPLPVVPAAAANHTPTVNHPIAAEPSLPSSNPTKHSDTSSLRPGMRIYSRVTAPDGTGDRWSPGTIYSAKIDPTKLSSQSSQTPNHHHPSNAKESLPLVFHIQYDDGNEDPNVPEENVMSQRFYEEALHELERHHALSRPPGYVSQYPHPLEGGTPVYCQWIDTLAPEIHGRWLPGTINSYEPASCAGNSDPNNPHHGNSSVPTEFSYHVLFDTEGERRDIPQGCVVDRTEYHELAKVKSRTNGHGGQGVAITRPIGDLYNLFSRKGCSSTHHQHNGNCNADDGENRTGGQLDLLFTASQMRNHHGAPPAAVPQLEQQQHATVTRKRQSTSSAEIYDSAYKRRAMEQIKTRMAEQQQETAQI